MTQPSRESLRELRAAVEGLDTYTPAGGWRHHDVRPTTVDRDAVLALIDEHAREYAAESPAEETE